MSATALAAWLAIPQEDRAGVIAMLRTRSSVGAASLLAAEAAAAESTSAVRRIVRQKSLAAVRANRAYAAAADLLAALGVRSQRAPAARRPSLEGLGLTSRSYNLLRGASIENIRDLTARTATDLRKVRGFGLGCLQEVETALAAHSLRLAEDAS